MRCCADSKSPPTLRIYSWQRHSISLGCLQRITPQTFDIDFCRSEGIEVVRRITGGRAVVHGSDVTFSIAILESDLPDGCSSVLASHQWLMGGIVRGLEMLGLEASMGARAGSTPPAAGQTLPADCFAHTAECDVRIGQSKVVGSAQVRRFGAILEQGSIPYAPPAFDTAKVFGRPQPAAGLRAEGFGFDPIARAVAEGFGTLTGHTLASSGLTQSEVEIAGQLAREFYADDSWTASGRSVH